MAKKDFTQAGLSAAEAFISTPEEAQRKQPERKHTAKKEATGKATTQLQTEIKLPVGFVLQREAKSKRLQLLVRPLLLQALKEKADRKGVSVNEYCNQVLEKAVKGE